VENQRDSHVLGFDTDQMRKAPRRPKRRCLEDLAAGDKTSAENGKELTEELKPAFVPRVARSETKRGLEGEKNRATPTLQHMSIEGIKAFFVQS